MKDKQFNINYKIVSGDSNNPCSLCCFDPDHCSDSGMMPCGSEFNDDFCYCVLCKK